MTSNIGANIIQEKLADAYETENATAVFEKTRAEVFQVLKTQLRPEFLNRVDDIIMFKPLSRTEILEIVSLQFEQLKKMLAQNQMQLTITDEALAHLANKGYDPQYGARPVKRVMQREMLNELSKIILSGKIDKEKPIQVDVADAKLTFVNA